jgi:hypothetical protein
VIEPVIPVRRIGFLERTPHPWAGICRRKAGLEAKMDPVQLRAKLFESL